jgi:hypothetical protein
MRTDIWKWSRFEGIDPHYPFATTLITMAGLVRTANLFVAGSALKQAYSRHLDKQEFENRLHAEGLALSEQFCKEDQSVEKQIFLMDKFLGEVLKSSDYLKAKNSDN